ncbi:MAG: exopolysaccharide biosynthesis protein, partial [Microvirga sp.]
LLIAWSLDILLLALPIPFDNFLPAWAILFFCVALVEDDGVMAMLGWLLTAVTAVWTVFLLMIGHAAIMGLIAVVKNYVFG